MSDKFQAFLETSSQAGQREHQLAVLERIADCLASARHLVHDGVL